MRETKMINADKYFIYKKKYFSNNKQENYYTKKRFRFFIVFLILTAFILTSVSSINETEKNQEKDVVGFIKSFEYLLNDNYLEDYLIKKIPKIYNNNLINKASNNTNIEIISNRIDKENIDFSSGVIIFINYDINNKMKSFLKKYKGVIIVIEKNKISYSVSNYELKKYK